MLCSSFCLSLFAYIFLLYIHFQLLFCDLLLFMLIAVANVVWLVAFAPRHCLLKLMKILQTCLLVVDRFFFICFNSSFHSFILKTISRRVGTEIVYSISSIIEERFRLEIRWFHLLIKYIWKVTHSQYRYRFRLVVLQIDRIYRDWIIFNHFFFLFYIYFNSFSLLKILWMKSKIPMYGQINGIYCAFNHVNVYG